MSGFDPTGLVDLHNHLVPGVDDGARTIGEALRHLRALAADGVTRLAVSPHLDGRFVNDPGAVQRRLARLEAGFRELRSGAAAERGLPELTFGQEILVPDPETARRLFVEPRVGITGTRYALIEFGFDLGEDPVGVVHAVRAAGRQPLVAHPERYRRDGGPVGIDEIRDWKNAGALLQVNAGSLLGDYGGSTAELGWKIVKAGLADVIATDHHADARPVSPAEAGRALAAHGAARQARLLLSENPRRVLADLPTLPVAPPGAEAVA